jgi:hypothetical protein
MVAPAEFNDVFTSRSNSSGGRYPSAELRQFSSYPQPYPIPGYASRCVTGAAQSYQHALQLDAALANARGTASDCFSYAQFLRKQKQPER